jgi:hypothetical protein
VLRVGEAAEEGRTVSGRPVVTVGVARALRELLAAPDALGDDGVGVTVTEALVRLAEATTRLACSIERFCDENDGGTGT